MQVLWPRFKRTIDGIPNLAVVIVQDANTHEVLMVAFTDEAGWKQTIETGNVSLFSTSRKKSWTKGGESGNVMQVQETRIDCDGDTILYRVQPQGAGRACHTNARSCFYRRAIPSEMLMEAPKAGEHETLEERQITE